MAELDKLYEHICHQIAREDDLFQKRFNACFFFNIAMATAATSQIYSNYFPSIRLIIFSGICIVSIVANLFFHDAMLAGNHQLRYLKGLFINNDALKDYPRPFFMGALPMDKIIPGRWQKFAILFLLLWAIVIPLGVFFIFDT